MGLPRRPRRLRRLVAISLLLSLIGVGLGLVGRSLWVGYHFRAGRAALERYHSREAAEHFQKCLRVWPRDGATLLLAARAARRLGAFDDAERHLEAYQRVRGNDDDLILERILLRAERGNVDADQTYCQSLIDQDAPAAPLVLEALAHGCLRVFRLQQAETLLHQWLEKEPDNPQALWLLGVAQQAFENLGDATARFRRVVQLDPEHDEARLRLCGVLVDLGQANEALPHLEYLGRRLPDNPRVGVMLARCQDHLGHTAEADAILGRVLDRHPRDAAALIERGQLALRTGRLEDAERWLRQGCEREPGDCQAHYNLHQCLMRRGKTAEAHAELKRMKQVEDDSRRFQEIITVHLGRTPHDASLHQEMGAILLRGSDVAEGLRWLHQALEENPGHRAAHQTLADYYQRIGELGRAARHRKQAGAARP